jgi:hypothetical protein
MKYKKAATLTDPLKPSSLKLRFQTGAKREPEQSVRRLGGFSTSSFVAHIKVFHLRER